MTATVAKLGIALEAQTAELRRGFNNATGAIKSLDKRVSGIAAGFGKATLAIGAAIAAFKSLQGIVRQVNASWQELSNNVDVADKLGTTVQELELLQFGAQRMGIEANNLNTGLQRMTRRIAEAAKGSGEAKGALEELGLSAERLNAQSPAASFQEISQALGGVENDADRLRLAFKFFDTEGAALKAFADLGVDGLNALQDEFNELGGSAAHNAEALKQAEIAIGDMQRAWKLFLAQVAQFVAPALEAIANAISRIVGLFNRLTGRAKEIDVVNELTEAEVRLDKATVGAAKAAEEQNKALEEQKRKLDELRSRADSITKSLQTPAENARDAVAELNMLFDKGLISVDTYRRGIEKAKESLEETRDAVEGIARGPGIATAGSGGFSARQQAIRERQKQLKIEEQQLAESRRIRQIMETFNVRAIQI